MRGLGRAYSVNFTAVAFTAQQDMIYLKPAADKPIVVESLYLGASGGTADAGDAQEELWDVQLIYLPATVTVGSGGGAYTPTPLLALDTAAAFTARINDTTKATSSGTALVRHPDSFNNRSPWTWTPPPEHGSWCASAAALVFRLNTTPADSILISGEAIVREFA